MRTRGFTLLEVMVAVAILGLGLTAILSAQAGAVSAASHARYMSLSLGLGRCKMSEIEQTVTKDGYQEMDVNDSGPCCEDDETPNISCTWKIEKPQFPEPSLGDLNLDTDVGAGPLGALGMLTKGGTDPSALQSGAGVKDVAQTLEGAGEGDLAAAASGGMSSIASMVMSMVYPDLKAMFEAATRRVTVTVSWTEGSHTFDVVLVQWLTDPRQAGILPEIPDTATPPGGSK